MGADDLAEALEMDSGALGVAGMNSGIAGRANAMDRPLPVMWQEGSPSTYWIDAATAGPLRAARLKN